MRERSNPLLSLIYSISQFPNFPISQFPNFSFSRFAVPPSNNKRDKGVVFMDLKVNLRDEGNVAFVGVAGELELDTHTGLREMLIRLAAARRPAIVVNLAEVSYIDSTGMGVLIGGEKRANEYGGKFAVVCANEKILRLFRMTGLDRALRIFPSEEEARKGVSPDEK